ncbi:MAG: hypothetical protein F6J87_09865 [Spirulina sp. SIO3F2]|nr:hypothetical protein [Spirulina sp. SIO3F2]
MKASLFAPHHFALCAATCLVVLSSGYSAAESAPLAATMQSHRVTTTQLDQSALLSMAYAAGVVDLSRQQSAARKSGLR